MLIGSDIIDDAMRWVNGYTKNMMKHFGCPICLGWIEEELLVARDGQTEPMNSRVVRLGHTEKLWN